MITLCLLDLSTNAGYYTNLFRKLTLLKAEEKSPTLKRKLTFFLLCQDFPGVPGGHLEWWSFWASVEQRPILSSEGGDMISSPAFPSLSFHPSFPSPLLSPMVRSYFSLPWFLIAPPSPRHAFPLYSPTFRPPCHWGGRRYSPGGIYDLPGQMSSVRFVLVSVIISSGALGLSLFYSCWWENKNKDLQNPNNKS